TREHALIALDFDGCLAPLVDDPDTARPIPEAAAALEELSAASDVDLALVSGRPADTLIHLANPPARPLIVGSHGAEVGRADTDGGSNREDFELVPAAPNPLEQAAADLTSIATPHPGTWVEHKPAAAVLHTRQAEPEVGAAARK